MLPITSRCSIYLQPYTNKFHKYKIMKMERNITTWHPSKYFQKYTWIFPIASQLDPHPTNFIHISHEHTHFMTKPTNTKSCSFHSLIVHCWWFPGQHRKLQYKNDLSFSLTAHEIVDNWIDSAIRITQPMRK